MTKGNKARAARLRAEASRLLLDAEYAYEGHRKYRMRGEATRLRRKAMKLDPPKPVDHEPIVVKRRGMTKEQRLAWDEDQEAQRESQYLNSPGAYTGGHHG